MSGVGLGEEVGLLRGQRNHPVHENPRGVDLVRIQVAGLDQLLDDLDGDGLLAGRHDRPGDLVLHAVVVEVLEQVKAGKLRPLGVTTKSRSSILPDIPAIGEHLPGYEVALWNGILGPAGLPPLLLYIRGQGGTQRHTS